MNFTPQELKYLNYVLSCATNYTIARGEQIDHPTVNHQQLKQKIKEQIEKIHWK